MLEELEFLTNLASGIADPTEINKPESYFYGLIVALPLAGYGLYCSLTESAPLGLLLIAVAMYLHFQYFWSQSARLVRYYEIGRFAALLLIVGALGWWIYEFAHKFF
jgi:hypothetical protein